MNNKKEWIVDSAKMLFSELAALEGDELIGTINAIRLELRGYSPFKSEPVDCVQWVKSDRVIANEYNPNSVAPTEMKLLEHSIAEDGYTQPIVSWMNGENHEVVDGFHRHRVGKESAVIQARIHGYLPLVTINSDRLGLGDRMAATIRHNRARGKHKVDSMSEIVVELKRRFWSDDKIANELGMEPDEVLRLQQVCGLAALFIDSEFSEAWEAESFSEISGDTQEVINED
jgi:ParB-like chromosome segregation protein Spo0J